MKGSRFVKAGNVTIGCMSTEAHDLLDVIMEQWQEHERGLKELFNCEPSIYGFAYWLVRWSGLIQPATEERD